MSLYPTYEDFLQAMIAGTFPVDFNGINKDGWTQLGTPLNKANLLSDTVISTLGLSTGANSTPNDAFNVLANVGNVHVWRKTSVSESPYYELGPIESVDLLGSGHISQWSTVRSSDSVSVANDGKVSLSNPSTGEWIGYAAYGSTPTGNYNFTGKFIQVTGTHESDTTGTSNGSLPGTFLEGVYFIPSDAVISQTKKDSNVFKGQCNKAQKVVGYKAGTHVTYLTSTNRNAYQEGDDAKEAGYVLGDMVNGKFAVSIIDDGNESQHWLVGDAINVDSSGNISIPNFTSVYIRGAYENDKDYWQRLVGKFAIPQKDGSSFVKNEAYFFPEDATGGRDNTPFGAYAVWVDRYQKVTGYPAIPAGTTIKYLGVLGDKTSIETGSYVGTGTSGSGNPNTLTFGFEPKFVHIQSYSIGNGDSTGYGFAFFLSGARGFTIGPSSSNDLFSLNAKFNKNILSWYQDNEYAQLNEKKVKYFFAALG